MILDKDGKEIKSPQLIHPSCPRCGSSRKNRSDISGFNEQEPRWACNNCGYEYPNEAEGTR